MNILFLSHCVPNPPDKGEKIRAYHELMYLSRRHQVHLVCFARNSTEIRNAQALRSHCVSVYAQLFSPARSLLSASVKFGFGASLTTSFYSSAHMRAYVKSLGAPPLSATVAYSSAMAQYAPAGIPLWLDMVDVDSEKWLQYAVSRWPGIAYKIEARRLRRLEAQYARRAKCTFLATPQEQQLMQHIAPAAKSLSVTNGVDFDYFDPVAQFARTDLKSRRYLAFVGSMDYYPNVDACRWFVGTIFPELRRCWNDLEFYIVGRNPGKAVLRLGNISGVVVTGGVADVRPYLAYARSVVAPLRIARGVQNKVLEALAMGKHVYASQAVLGTFGGAPLPGVIPCDTAGDYMRELEKHIASPVSWEVNIREGARSYFTWNVNLQRIAEEIERAENRLVFQDENLLPPTRA
jgi:sugar transferase (PEP-CTERM/EpsH1 system associated)